MRPACKQKTAASLQPDAHTVDHLSLQADRQSGAPQRRSLLGVGCCCFALGLAGTVSFGRHRQPRPAPSASAGTVSFRGHNGHNGQVRFVRDLSRRIGGAWWSRTRGLPVAVYRSWRADVTARPGPQGRILAWTDAEPGFCIGSPALLSVGDTDGWLHLGWHQIEHGGWNAETSTLSWTAYGGRRGRVRLSMPGRLPELFRERVAASIAVERFVALEGERGVTVTARRDLSGAGVLSWHSSLTRGLKWTGEGVAEAAEQATAQLRSEYETGPTGW